ncbi:MAG: hypothetical protein JWN79_2863 [Gemmatimonadetes bacterium]|jgi:hypothetical protein|nr:hypothetical protein [Gemmatimonadota bacterium]
MFTNVGPPDRWLRVSLGAALLCLVFYGPHTPWGWLGILPLASGLVGCCPLYRMTGKITQNADAGCS